jgi:uncharacterized protein involved in exopolysaccharide biosynthesis
MQSFSRELLFVVFYNKKLVLLLTALFFALSCLLALFLPSIYSSSAKFMLSANGNHLDPLQQEHDFDLKNKMVRALQNQKEIIFSSPVLEKTAFKIDPNADAKKMADIIDNLKKSTKVTPPKGESFEGSNVFYLTCENKEPAKAQAMVAALTESYLEISGDFSRSKASYSYDFFRKQVEQLHDEMARKEAKLRQYETTNAAALIDILNLESGKNNVESGPRALLNQANLNRQKFHQDLLGIKLQVENLEAGLKERSIPVLLPEMEVTGRAITAYRNKIAQLQMQINEMRAQFTPEFEPLRALNKELAETVELLREEVRSYIGDQRLEMSILEGKISEIDNQIGRYESSISETAQQRSTYEALKQECSIASQSYTDAVAKMEQARMASVVNQDIQAITIVEQPQTPKDPIKPNRPLIILMGMFGGLFVGIASALIFDFMDHTIKSPEDIERWLEVPALGFVTHFDP